MAGHPVHRFRQAAHPALAHQSDVQLPGGALVSVRRSLRPHHRSQDHGGGGRHPVRPGRGPSGRLFLRYDEPDPALHGAFHRRDGDADRAAQEGQGLVFGGSGRRQGAGADPGGHVRRAAHRGLSPARCGALDHHALLHDRFRHRGRPAQGRRQAALYPVPNYRLAELEDAEDAQRDEGELVVSEIVDRAGAGISRRDVDVRLQTLPLDEGYWLDTGIVFHAV